MKNPIAIASIKLVSLASLLSLALQSNSHAALPNPCLGDEKAYIAALLADVGSSFASETADHFSFEIQLDPQSNDWMLSKLSRDLGHGKSITLPDGVCSRESRQYERAPNTGGVTLNDPMGEIMKAFISTPQDTVVTAPTNDTSGKSISIDSVQFFDPVQNSLATQALALHELAVTVSAENQRQAREKSNACMGSENAFLQKTTRLKTQSGNLYPPSSIEVLTVENRGYGYSPWDIRAIAYKDASRQHGFVFVGWCESGQYTLVSDTTNQDKQDAENWKQAICEPEDCGPAPHTGSYEF